MRARIAFAAWTVVIAAAVFQPDPTLASRTVSRVGALLVDVGAPATVSAPAHVEALVNAAMFFPAAALAMLGWSRRRWADVVVLAFIGSLLVEVVQALLLDARSAQAVDVVANTSGALAGAVLGELLRRRLPVP